jgi:hypothetical protein
MDGPTHYRESERLLAMCTDSDGNPPADPEDAASLTPYLRAAQVHATLALAAATAYPVARYETTPTGSKWTDVMA